MSSPCSPLCIVASGGRWGDGRGEGRGGEEEGQDEPWCCSDVESSVQLSQLVVCECQLHPPGPCTFSHRCLGPLRQTVADLLE